jgi:hypothetical protein
MGAKQSEHNGAYCAARLEWHFNVGEYIQANASYMQSISRDVFVMKTACLYLSIGERPNTAHTAYGLFSVSLCTPSPQGAVKSNRVVP